MDAAQRRIELGGFSSHFVKATCFRELA